MSQLNKIGFIGSGNITQALVKGLTQFGQVKPHHIYVTNRSNQKALRLAQQFGVTALNTNEELIETCDLIFLAIKPHDFYDLTDDIRGCLHPSQHVVSLLAGIDIDTLQRKLPTENISRMVPNTAVGLGAGVIGIFSRKKILAESLHKLCSPLGYSLLLKEESLIDTVLVATSSGLGFVLELMSYYCDWLESHGFTPSESRELIQNTFLGAGRLASQHMNLELEALIAQIASKKGVTESGLKTLRSFEMDRLIRMSLDQAQKRNEELARGL